MRSFFLMLVCHFSLFSNQTPCRLDCMKNEFLFNSVTKSSERHEEIEKAFVAFDKLCRPNASYADCINSSDMQKIFNCNLSSRQHYDAQLLLTALLHKFLLEVSVKKINMQLQKVFETKAYWVDVLSQKKLSYTANFLGNNNFASKQMLEKKIILLQRQEELQAELLGVCLSSLSKLKKIEKIDQIESALLLAFEPFKQFEINKQPECVLSCFEYTAMLSSYVKERQLLTTKILKAYKIPRYFEKNGHAYPILILTSVIGLLTMHKYKNCRAAYQEKALRAGCGFFKDFLLEPLHGLKKTIWDRPEFSTKKFDLENLPDSIWCCYTPERAIKYPLQTILHNLNCVIGLGEEVVKRQQINHYLSVIIPTAGSLYLLYRKGKSYYRDTYYFNSMRTILRTIDILCNTLIGQQDVSYIDHGYLFALVLQLQKYVDCLSLQEQQMISYDLSELISFDFSPIQKQKVVERMYRTYSFLK